MTPSSRFLTAALLLAIAIGGVSMLPTATKRALHTQGALHPWLHFTGFALLAFFLLGAVRSGTGRALLFAALITFAYSTEAGESHADGWPIERGDVKLDFAGVVCGSLLALAVSRRLPRRNASLWMG